MKTILLIVVLAVIVTVGMPIVVDLHTASAQTQTASPLEVERPETNKPVLAQNPATLQVTRDQPKIAYPFEEGFAGVCRSVATTFAWWDHQTQKCIALDVSSDQIYEPN